MAHCFNNFYEKILTIYCVFPSNTLIQDIILVEESCMSMMDTIQPFMETDIKELLKGHLIFSVQLTLCLPGLRKIGFMF